MNVETKLNVLMFLIMLCMFGLGSTITSYYFEKNVQNQNERELLSVERVISECRNRYAQEWKIDNSQYPIITFVEVKE